MSAFVRPCSACGALVDTDEGDPSKVKCATHTRDVKARLTDRPAPMAVNVTPSASGGEDPTRR